MSDGTRFHDPVLGAFTFDPRTECFIGSTNWNGNTVAIRLAADDPTALPSVAQTARTLCGNSTDWDRRVRAFAVEMLLPLKNRSWLGENEPGLTGERFLGRMKLTAISVDQDGAFDFWHDDGGLFWGHSIQVSGQPRRRTDRRGYPRVTCLQHEVVRRHTKAHLLKDHERGGIGRIGPDCSGSVGVPWCRLVCVRVRSARPCHE